MTGNQRETNENSSTDTRFSRRRLLGVVGSGATGTTLAAGLVSGNNGRGNDDEEDDDYIVGTDPGHASEARSAAAEVKRELDFGEIGQAVAGRFPEQARRGLQNNPHVRYIEENGQMEALGETITYGIEITDADVAHDEGHTGDEVSVAILDTGIDAQHETLVPNLGDGWAATAAACDTSDDCDPSFFCPSAGTDTCYEEWDDDNDHGTHVAGIAAAAMNNTGTVGVAPDATLHSVKVLDCCGSGQFDDIAAGIEWATDHGHEVINMSLGGPESDAVSDAVEYAAAKNVVIVAAAGNDGPCDDCVGSPADHPEVIAVSATNENDELADFSSTGPEVEIAAPGEDILSSITRSDYGEFSGTSMSSPFVAGAAASVIAAGGDDYDREAILDTLKDGAEDIGLGDNEQGAGRLNVYNAIDSGDGTDPDEPGVDIDVHTDPATGVETEVATLNGALEDLEEAEEAEVWFEYGRIGEGFPQSTGSASFEPVTAFSSDINALSSGTSYEYRVKAEAEGTSETGGVETFQTEEDDDGGFCYITTAAADDPGTLDSLRRFRDDSMKRTSIGRSLVRLYYRISPPIAATIEAHPHSRTRHACRWLVDRCAALSDRQERTRSAIISAGIGVLLTGLYCVGILVGAGGHASIRLRDRARRTLEVIR